MFTAMKHTAMKTCFCYDVKNELNDVSKETGFDRIRRMYSPDIYGMNSPELHCVIQSASSTVIVSALVGACISMLREKDNYFRQNTASAFDSQHLARRKLTDTMTLKAFRGAFTYGIKYGSFSSLYLLSTMTVANYNNKITIYEHIGTGTLLGALVRFNYGLKGMAAAGCVGGFLGCLAGGVLVFGMWLSNSTLDDLRKWQNEQYYQDLRKNVIQP